MAQTILMGKIKLKNLKQNYTNNNREFYTGFNISYKIDETGNRLHYINGCTFSKQVINILKDAEEQNLTEFNAIVEGNIGVTYDNEIKELGSGNGRVFVNMYVKKIILLNDLEEINLNNVIKEIKNYFVQENKHKIKEEKKEANDVPPISLIKKQKNEFDGLAWDFEE